MRLKTDKRESSDCSFVIDGTRDELRHDAAYAHALVEAMDHYERTKLHGSGVLVTLDALRSRADEFMREWGYPDD